MLSIENVSKTYRGGIAALKRVSLQIPTGMFGLLGPNGAGKSTLMRTIATLQEPDEGRILLDDVDVVRDKDAVRRVLGYLPQEFGVYPRVTALQMLDHLAALKGFSAARERSEMVERLLVMSNLWDVRKRYLTTYSGGMRQRFGIAQALIGDPRLVIVDEPTAGLDPEERNRFLDLLSEIGENVVVLLSTHIVEDVSDLCPRVAIIAEGEVRQQGEPRALIASLDGTIWRKVVTRTELEEVQKAQTVLCTRWLEGRLVAHFVSAERPGADYEPVGADLEDVYFHTLRARRAA